MSARLARAHPYGVVVLGQVTADLIAGLSQASDDLRMQLTRGRRWFALAVVLASVALLELTMASMAQQEDDAKPDQADAAEHDLVPAPVELPPPGGGGPSLACGVWPLPAGPDGASRATFTCWVSGAPDGDTSFTLEAVRLGEDGQSLRPIAPVCGETALADGKGVCTGTVADPSGGILIGGLVVRGTLHPSGTQLGPVYVSPTP